MRAIGIGVAGLGNVGREAVRLFIKHRVDFSRRLGAKLELRWVCDRDVEREARKLRLPASARRTRRYEDIIADPRVDVVIELFGGLESARQAVLGALRAGKHVVTGNKLLLASCWDEVGRAGARFGRRVYFEAAVAGGIPIISALRQGLAANRISSVVGILNGTTNHILTKMVHEGCELDEALREAQRLGMAEKDPTLDLNGTDTAHKISILASLLTGGWLKPGDIPRQGIEGIDARDIRFAVSELQRTVRLIGTISIDWRARAPRVEAHVQPTLIGLKHPLAAVHGGYNAILVSASPAEDLMFYGKGAGPGPAASAVLGDLLTLSQEILAMPGNKTGTADFARGPVPRLAPETDAPFYMKLRVRDVPGALSRITGILGHQGISIARIHQDIPESKKEKAAAVMIVTHKISRQVIERASRAISALPMVLGAPTKLRMLP